MQYSARQNQCSIEPFILIGSPVNYADCLNGSPVTIENTDPNKHLFVGFACAVEVLFQLLQVGVDPDLRQGSAAD